MLNDLIQKFNVKNRPAKGSPLANLTATHQWVEQLQQLHEYEAHQQVVLLLGEYNRLTTPFNDQQLHMLGVIEQFGSKLQHGLIAQFLKNQADLKYAGKSLWQEIVAFYWQLAQAYQRLTVTKPHQQKYASALPSMVLRALHYQGKLIQWRYLRYELPTPQTWNALHKLYQYAVLQGFSEQSLVLKGSAYCSCEQAYARILLLHLMRPVGLSPSEVELAAYWAWKWRDTLHFRTDFDADRDTHFVALLDNAPPQSLDSHVGASASVRYWSIADTVQQLKVLQASLAQHDATIKLYGVTYTANPNALLKHIHSKLVSSTSHVHNNMTSPSSEVQISCGNKTIVSALANTGSIHRTHATYRAIGHPDEAYYCLDMKANDDGCKTSTNTLLIVYNEQLTKIPALSVVRWIERSSHASITLGMERLGLTPRLVAFHPLSDAIAPSPFLTETASCEFIAIALNQPSTLVSFHAIQRKYLDIRDGDYIYRIRIRAILEQTPHWLRVQFIRLSRSYQPARDE